MNRRNVLKAGLGASALFLPGSHAWVWAQQSDGALKLVRAPKVALVIGNGKYKDAPELKNAPNDARAIGDALKASGFEVTLKIDTRRDEMLEAIRAYVHLMEQKKHVGLFYFAGHGVQLAWRNYLLPVDAAIDKIDDVAKQSVDIARLLDGLTKAANPMNVIILDACRENPFGKDFRVEHKGLSQMDAPNLTFLAYATSPGNVASDGDGVNGLYTENLLREIKVPEARIEDVFKRVRLNVRRKSNGAQVPWESTSLEDDFWFLPPKDLGKPSDDAKEKAFKEEFEAWRKVQTAREKAAGMQPVMVAAAGRDWAGGLQLAQAAGPALTERIAMLEDYLRRYPNGNFSEHAQLELDRALARQGEKRVDIINAAANPFTRGSARADIAFKIGDTYVVRQSDIISKVVQGDVTSSIVRISDSEVVWNTGAVTDLLGNPILLRDGRRFTPSQFAPGEFAVGKRWTTRFIVNAPGAGGDFRTEFELRIVARERITLAAGTFDAFRVEYTGLSVGPAVVTVQGKNWYAPEQVRVSLASETFRRVRDRGGDRIIESSRRELVSFKQA